MRTFKDSTGQAWSVEINFGTVLRVRSLAGVDLLEPAKPTPGGNVPMEAHLWFDLPALFEVLAAVLDPQLKAAGLAADAFAERLAGELLAAREALFLEWRDFFRALQRPDLATLLEKTAEWGTLGAEKIRTMAEGADLSPVDRDVRQKLSTLTVTFGSSPESSD